MSQFDKIYRKILLTKFFTKGWGKPEDLKRIFEFRKILSNREKCQHLIPEDYPVHIEKESIQKDYKILEGHFESPLKNLLPGIMPKSTEIARFQVILPNQWKTNLKPVCLHLAGTGDHYFWRRRNFMALPLLKEGIGSIILENPYYGTRKPKEQLRSSLHNVSDLFVMGGALILESKALLHWCERQGFGPLGITGISMGGNMASLAATNWHKPISLIPCLSWSTASCVFTQGVMSGAIPWEVLQRQYYADEIYEKEIRELLVSPEDHYKSAYSIGQEFVRTATDLTSDNRFEGRHFQHDQKVGNLSLEVSSAASQEQQFGAVSKTEANQARNQKIDCIENLTVNVTHDHKESGNQTVSTGQVFSKSLKSDQNLLDNISKQNDSQSRSYATNSFSKSIAQKLKRPQVERPTVISKSPVAEESSTILQQKAVDFMKGVMDECTHLGNFSIPVDTELIIIIAAKHDSYVPRDNVLNLSNLWPGSEVRYIDTGHIMAFIFNHNVFRQAVVDSFKKQIKKYYS
ncbi:hypothetical protein ACJMK2_032256 [Sinanodonta woodiana]|uniref:Protein ABHD18 n=1 Tax=Sinanodonta woodiana TaxID=1069815 RepID=A0ABD3X172_SINWO